MANFTAIKKEQHKNLKVASKRNFSKIANQHIMGATAKEFTQLATSFPIMMIKEGEVYRSVILMGLEAGENIFYQNEKMEALSIPQSLALSPFALGLDPEKENTLTACIDLDSEFVGEDKDIALFDEEGNDTELFKAAQENLGSLYENEVMTEKFTKELVECELLQEFELLIDLANGEKKRLVGLYGIDDKKFNELSDEKIIDFHKRGLFIPIHSMVISLGQIHRLVHLRNEYTDKKIAGIRIQPRTAE